MNTVIDEVVTDVVETAEVKIRPNVDITEEMSRRIKEIAVDYALGEKYTSMSRYTITIGELGRSLGLSYGQFYDELRAALFELEGSIKFDKNAVTALLMKR